MKNERKFYSYLSSLLSNKEDYSKEELIDIIRRKHMDIFNISDLHLAIYPIERFIMNEFRFDFNDLKCNSQKMLFLFPRQIAIYLLRRDTKLTLADIGLIFNRSHSLIHRTVKIIDNNMDFDKRFKAIINKYDNGIITRI